MKRITYIAAILGLGTALISGCGRTKDDPGSVYMPDMNYSRTIESYAHRDSLVFTSNPAERGGDKIFFNEMPPAGTVKRGDLDAYTLPHDSVGYKNSASVKNPLDTVVLTKAQLTEAARLFDINCSICHGAKGTGNGPIADKIGAVANLTLPKYVSMADGTMFHSITYGLNNMGSYASQLNRHDRWLMVKYIRNTIQGGAKAATATADTTAKAAK